jgi:glycosyltransferase involved in cell wall biosynthesis
LFLRPAAIHQIHESCAYGDGITNGMFFIQRLLQESGYLSEIYCQNIPARLSQKVKPLASFEDRECDLILFHYSLGTPHDAWITEIKSPTIIVYHNITPHEYFPRESELYRLCRMGRTQLSWWGEARGFVGAIADSEFNGNELVEAGFPSVASIGLLVDLGALKSKRGDPPNLLTPTKKCKTILFVGNLIEHKGQVELVQAFDALAKISDVPLELLLAGGTASEGYRTLVQDEIEFRGLTQSVRLVGKCTNEELYAYYRRADLYLSLSEHEGFGMPLVEAMAFDVPVLAFDAASVSATLGGGGRLVSTRQANVVAEAALQILTEPGLRTPVLRAQREALKRYESSIIAKSFENYLRICGFNVDLAPVIDTAPLETGPCWRVEGPFDSSYSLAIVNRQLALALADDGEEVVLASRDDEFPYPPSAEFLANNPSAESLWRRGADGLVPQIALRNQYPPYVLGMRGVVRAVANYAWEESGFPAQYVRDFNMNLNVVTVTSRFVAKVLRDNGVHTPMMIVGNGVDHIAPVSSAETLQQPRSVFRFLHVSSGFPRKGADALLEAWGEAFSVVDKVELVIKTFANPHNDIPEALRRFGMAYPEHATIKLIDRDMDAAELREFYLNADALVCPSRGEGFGLPLAEAIWLGRSVITTGYGGQSDFCTPETAWLCDYSFARSQTHLSVPNSVWIEPSVNSLAGAMIACRDATDEERRRRIIAGQSLLARQFSWAHVAARTKLAVQSAERSSSGAPAPKIAWISTWNTRCGIAAYARSLACAFEPERLTILANRAEDLLGRDEERVRRCWAQGWDDPLDDLYQEVMSGGVDIAVVQFNFGFFRLDYLARFIDRVRAKGIQVLVFLHATLDVVKPDVTIRLSDIGATLSRCERLLVHSVHDLNGLKAIGLVENVTLFPQGMANSFEGDSARQRAALANTKDPLIASFGFLLPHKGLRELVEAFSILRKSHENAHLLMLNALYPAAESEAEHLALKDLIAAKDLGEHITLDANFLPEIEVVAKLASADAIVFPYQQTQESGSAAIKIGLASLAPVACTPLPIFDDGAEVIHRLRGCSPLDIAEGVDELLLQPRGSTVFADRRTKQRAWVDAHSWKLLSRRLDGLIRGLAVDARLGPGRTGAP